MRIRFELSGGLAFIPKLNAAIDIDTSSLPIHEAREVESLVAAADFFARPSQPVDTNSGADQRKYTLTIEDKGVLRTVHVSDPINDSALDALISHIRSSAA